MKYRTAVGGVVSLALAGATLLAQAGQWQTLLYPDPEPGVWRTWCLDLNESGDLVGYYRQGLGPAPDRAFLMADGQYYSLHPAGATNSSAWGINARGDIVGDYWIGSTEHGFLLRGGELITIDLEGRAMAHLRDINARGDIAGNYMTTSTSPLQGFVLENDGSVWDVVFEEAVSTRVSGINDHGDVAGNYTDTAGVDHGFIRSHDGEFTTLDYPLAVTTVVQRINSNGVVAGYYWDDGTPSRSHGFVWRHGEFEQTDFPGAADTMIHGFNNQGETCGMMRFGTPPGPYGGFAHLW